MDKIPKKNVISFDLCCVLSFAFLDPVPKLWCRITTLCCVISHLSTDFTLFGNARPGLALHGPVQSVPVWHSLVWRSTREFHMMSHVLVSSIRKEHCLALK